MLSDAPRYVRRKATEDAEGGDSGPVSEEAATKEAGDIVKFFQSNLEP